MSDPTPVAAPTPSPQGTPTPQPRVSPYADFLAALQAGWLARGNAPGNQPRPSPFAGMDNATLLGGMFGGGPGRVVPPSPSPGIGSGMDYPIRYEDDSYGYQGDRFYDELYRRFGAWMNQRFPNNR